MIGGTECERRSGLAGKGRLGAVIRVGRLSLLSLDHIGGPQPLAGEQDTGVPVRGYDLNPVTLGPGLHGLRWHPPRAPTDFVAIGSARNRQRNLSTKMSQPGHELSIEAAPRSLG